MQGAALPHRCCLLPLPPCLTGGEATPAGLVQGLDLTGHFLKRELATAPGARPLPEARARLVDLLARSPLGVPEA